uniref:Uncharacterized protein n=1 Tax=Spongospora subterranea TaxID=70186 RepID=A0A0H5RAQ9_9EUKA|eukprot:CRZ10856.1 hypothetical protein [Spongospora subterranea]
MAAMNRTMSEMNALGDVDLAKHMQDLFARLVSERMGSGSGSDPVYKERLEIGIERYMECLKLLQDRVNIRESNADQSISTEQLLNELNRKKDLIQHYHKLIRSWEANFAALKVDNEQILNRVIPS